MNSHDFEACGARIVASLWCHGAGVIPNVTRPRLANSEGALAHRDTASAGGKDRDATSVPLEAAVEEEYMNSLL